MQISVKGLTSKQIQERYNVPHLRAWRAMQRGYIVFYSKSVGTHREVQTKDILNIKWINRRKLRKHRTIEDFLYGRSQLNEDLYRSINRDIDGLRDVVIAAIDPSQSDLRAASEKVISHPLVKRFVIFPYNMARRKFALASEEAEFKKIINQMLIDLSPTR